MMLRMRRRLGVALLFGGVVAAWSDTPSCSKLGIYLFVSFSAGASAIDGAHPRVLKILGTDATMLRAAREYKAATPEGLVVLRVYTTRRWTLQDDPSLAGQRGCGQVRELANLV